jgi:mRNA interferase HigB
MDLWRHGVRWAHGFTLYKLPATSQFGRNHRRTWRVRVVSRKNLREHWENPDRAQSEQPLKTWYSVVRKAEWKTHDDVKADFGASVDRAHGKYVSNVKGNDFRLVCVIDFARHGVLVLWIGTHREYDELNKNNGRKLKLL